MCGKLGHPVAVLSPLEVDAGAAAMLRRSHLFFGIDSKFVDD